MIITALLFLAVASTGVGHDSPPTTAVHKWSGHALLIAAWFFVPISAGVAAQRCIRRRPVFAIVLITMLLLLLAIVVLASLTGYLGPSYFAEYREETKNRFQVLHLVGLPALIAMLLAAWYWSFGPDGERSAEQTRAQEVATQPSAKEV